MIPTLLVQEPQERLYPNWSVITAVFAGITIGAIMTALILLLLIRI
jgi:hypothetical protein